MYNRKPAHHLPLGVAMWFVKPGTFPQCKDNPDFASPRIGLSGVKQKAVRTSSESFITTLRRNSANCAKKNTYSGGVDI